jgi:cytoskeletal protein CcmA (bactofilin family)
MTKRGKSKKAKMKKQKSKIGNNNTTGQMRVNKKIHCGCRSGAALLIVLFIVMVATILSLGFLSRSDVELACGANMVLRTQMDYLAESGLEHARGLILSNDNFLGNWAASSQQLVEGSDDYYDITVTKLGLCNYQIDSYAYRKKDSEKIAQSNLKAELRLDPCIAFWANNSTTIPNNVTITGDVYCGGTVTNDGNVIGDIFAVALLGFGTKRGQLYSTDKAAAITSPNLDISDFTPSYVPDANGNVELIGNTTINGTLVVDGNITISGGSTISVNAPQNSPALLISGEVKIKDYSRLIIEGFAQITRGISVESTAALEISGALFIVGNGSISGSGNVVIATGPAEASLLLPPDAEGNQKRWSPAGGAFFRSVKRD